MPRNRNSEKLDGGVPVGDEQFRATTGNVLTSVGGFMNDAGAGKPPAPGAYGAIAQGPDYPTGSKFAGGNTRAMTAWTGTRGPGGGGRGDR